MDYASKVAELNRNKPGTYYIKTFGCQQNEHDSEILSGMLERMEYAPADSLESSSLILYNTCCVREHAEQKMFGHLGKLKRLKNEKPDIVIVLCGCMMQQEHVVDEVVKKYRHVDIIFGTHAMHLFPGLLYKVLSDRDFAVEVGMDEYCSMDGIEPVRQDTLKAWVNISTGCDNFCSYCIVPYVRGRERSRDNRTIINEVEKLASQGCKEICLLGQNVNSYRDNDENIDFAELLYRVNEIKGIERIRFMTSHPKDFSFKTAKAMRECEKVCEHLHLPLQSGSNKVLKMMNRGYTREEYLEKVQILKSEISGIALTTDIIVGFPGESDEDFEDTLDMMRKTRYDSAFTFIYSRRKGTPAENYHPQVEKQEAKKRFESLLDVQYDISTQISRLYEGKTVEVLVEGCSKKNSNRLTGRTRTNKVVNFNGEMNIVGRTTNVRITNAKTWHLEGNLA